MKKNRKHTVTLEYDYVMGHLRYGHMELAMDDEELADFKKKSNEEQVAWVDGMGDFVLDDYSVEGLGEPSDSVQIKELEE